MLPEEANRVSPRAHLLLAGIVAALLTAATVALLERQDGPASSLAVIALASSAGLAMVAALAYAAAHRSAAAQLAASRDELRGVLERLGATLRATADLGRMLSAVLEGAHTMLQARGGAVYWAEPDGGLVLAHAIGIDATPGARLRTGEGIAGRVALSGVPLLVPSRWVRPPLPAAFEPRATTAIAAPLAHGEETVGVLALYGRAAREPFSDRDLATLTSFGAQASVAIENVVLREEAGRLATTDPLTGAFNRRWLERVLVGEVERCARFGRIFSVLMIDLDHFKAVNDRYGHRQGDAVLVEVARRLATVCRANVDTLARVGGEEFVCVLPETPPAGAAAVAERIVGAMRAEPFLHHGRDDPLRVTVSVGAALYPQDGLTPESLLAAADRALYEAKQAGRDRFCGRAGTPAMRFEAS